MIVRIYGTCLELKLVGKACVAFPCHMRPLWLDEC